MKKTKNLLALIIAIAMIISNCVALFNSVVFATDNIAIHFDTKTYTDNTVTFIVGEVQTTITISGTASTIHEDGENCGIGLTEHLGSEVTLRVDEKYNQETMEIYAEEPGENGFYHNLPVDNQGYIQFSGTETDNQTGLPRDWGIPNDIHLGIKEKGQNHGGENPGQQGISICFDTETSTATTATFNVKGVETTITISGEGLSLEKEEHNARLEIPESLKNSFKIQVDGNYNPETMEIYACDGGDDAFTEVLPIDENRYVIFPENLIARGRFHFGIVEKGFSPVNMITITIDANGGKKLEGFRDVIDDVPTGEEFVVDEIDLFMEAPACYEFAGWQIGDKFYAEGEPVVFTENTTIKPQWRQIDHSPIEVVTTQMTKATLSKDGVINKSIESKCEECGEILGGRGESVVIPFPKTIVLSKTSFTYNKKVQKPSVKVVGSDGKTIASSNYDIKYSNNNSKKIGEYKVTITFKGNYEGTKTLKYTIQPKGTSLSKLKAGKKQFIATWKAQKTETSGYELQYSINKNFKNGKKVNIKKNKTTSSTIKKLNAKKKYYVRIRTYKTVGGKKIYSDWSKSKNVTTKK